MNLDNAEMYEIAYVGESGATIGLGIYRNAADALAALPEDPAFLATATHERRELVIRRRNLSISGALDAICSLGAPGKVIYRRTFISVYPAGKWAYHDEAITPAAPSENSKTKEAGKPAAGDAFLGHPIQTASDRFEIEGRLFKALHAFKTAAILDELDEVAGDLEAAADSIRNQITRAIQYRQTVAARG